MNFHRWEFGFVLPKIEIWLYLHSSSIPSVTAARGARPFSPASRSLADDQRLFPEPSIGRVRADRPSNGLNPLRKTRMIAADRVNACLRLLRLARALPAAVAFQVLHGPIDGSDQFMVPLALGPSLFRSQHVGELGQQVAFFLPNEHGITSPPAEKTTAREE